MIEVFEGVLSIGAGVYVFLVSIGKLQISKNQEKSDAWMKKYSSAMKIVGPGVALFGCFIISNSIVGF